jgi:DNA-binding NarL/FixJ family response regulator
MRVMLADGEQQVRCALRVLLTVDMGMQVVGEAVDAADLLPELQASRPDVLVVDWGLLSAEAARTVTSLRAINPHLQVITMSGQAETRQHALAAGANAFVSKADSPERMIDALRATRTPGATGNAADNSAATALDDDGRIARSRRHSHRG